MNKICNMLKFNVENLFKQNITFNTEKFNNAFKKMSNAESTAFFNYCKKFNVPFENFKNFSEEQILALAKNLAKFGKDASFGAENGEFVVLSKKLAFKNNGHLVWDVVLCCPYNREAEKNMPNWNKIVNCSVLTNVNEYVLGYALPQDQLHTAENSNIVVFKMLNAEVCEKDNLSDGYVTSFNGEEENTKTVIVPRNKNFSRIIYSSLVNYNQNFVSKGENLVITHPQSAHFIKHFTTNFNELSYRDYVSILHNGKELVLQSVEKNGEVIPAKQFVYSDKAFDKNTCFVPYNKKVVNLKGLQFSKENQYFIYRQKLKLEKQVVFDDDFNLLEQNLMFKDAKMHFVGKEFSKDFDICGE